MDKNALNILPNSLSNSLLYMYVCVNVHACTCMYVCVDQRTVGIIPSTILKSKETIFIFVFVCPYV